ncbi:glycoside hydrolase family 9 protein [Dyadobacter arcticus]|uniref:Por secretion system C-terminal sorting domain-containing protein n=1 Tax=Dyadobacter arcticus TaxID=1078754 RepID=A0ABX0UKV4_9BACT|nr:glycoside hydrolase family 9 protein [Dyadobacter arcticus]NIJ53591.1 hypothetical protein [Dyadobacter arcticus]
MKHLFILNLITLYLSLAVTAQNKVLWNGELPNPTSCNTAYGSVIFGADAHSGNFYFRAEPDNAHSPRIGFNCSGMWRSDISGFDQLRFFIKSNTAGQMTSVRFTTYYAKSQWINLSAYILGGGQIGTSYKEVRIPLQLFKSAGYDLSSVEYLEFGTSLVSQIQFFLDDIGVVDLKPPLIKMQPVSNGVLKLLVSERFDTTDCHNVLNYTLQSADDPNYQAVLHPVKIGRHHYVTGLTAGSGSPKISSELFLIFDKPLKNNDTYHLTTNALSDLSQNFATVDTTFHFSDLELYGNIKANHVGYLPKSPKLGKLGNFLGDAWFLPVNKSTPPTFSVINNAEQVVFTGKATFLKSDSSFSGENVFELDFSALESPGQYYIYVPGFGRSERFTIGDDVFDAVYLQTTRALYYQRAGKLESARAGKWAREGLPAVTAEIHSSHTNSPLFNNKDHPPGKKIPMSQGWLDAGDYGRYVPTAASALFILFTAYELYPQKFPDNHLNIPESGNNIPDILDEIKYETDWLKQMQAPDGGVYFRVTPATWSSGLPGEENNTLFVSEKTTQSTALFAAAMAMAYRNLKKHFPTYADDCLLRAKNAWIFLRAHPSASAPVIVPGISAGPYPDPEDRDNRAWAAAELYKSTGESAYKTDFSNWYGQIPHEFHATMSWQQHTVKAAWAYATTNFPTDPAIGNEFRYKLTTDVLVNYNTRTMVTHAYHGAYHQFKGFVGYGTFAMAQSYAFDYIMFSYVLNQPNLLDYAKMQLDIPLGNNPLSRSFITGIGKNSPKFPLHWSTVPGKFDEPVPGVPVFGPAASLVMNRPSSYAIQDLANRYPSGFKKEDPYPVLRRNTDAREAVEMSEITVQEMAVTAAAFAFFSSVNNPALPVKLVRFEAKADQCKIRLSWVTTEEINADYFSVEKSNDGKTFSEIGTLPAIGDTKVTQEYVFSDPQPDFKNYYRLKQVDRDGKSEFSRIVFAADPCNGFKVDIQMPGRNFYELKTAFEKNADGSSFTAVLYNIQGVRKKEFSVKTAGVTLLDGSGLTPGIYILKISNSNKQQVYTDKLIFY